MIVSYILIKKLKCRMRLHAKDLLAVLVTDSDSKNLEISPKVCISKESENALDLTIPKGE